MIFTKRILKRLGIVTVNPFKINRDTFCFAVYDREFTNDSYVLDILILNSLMHENRRGENCKDCEIQWTYYKSIFDMFTKSNLLNKVKQQKGRSESH